MLTQEQLDASQSPHDRTVVIAGAGTGKTTLLIERVMHLLRLGVNPDAILVLTFTRRAAQEIKQRLASADMNTNGMVIGTFHSVALEMLSMHRKVTPISDETADSIVSDICKTSRKTVRRAVLDAFRTAHAMGMSDGHEAIEQAVKQYEARLNLEGAVDWLGMLTGAIKLGDLLPSFQHVLIDEDQDTDDLQRRFASVVGRDATMFVVGDDRQQLYEWRGVRPEAFTSQPGHRFSLTQTWRFTPDIADLANKLASLAGSTSPPLASSRPGTAIEVSSFTVEDAIDTIADRGFSHSDIAVLCRYNQQVDRISEHLTTLGISVRKPVRRNHDLAVAVLNYISNPWSKLFHQQLGSAGTKLLSSVIDSENSQPTNANLVETWKLTLPQSNVDTVLGQLVLTESIRESFEWWKNTYAGVSIPEALADYITGQEVAGSGVTVTTIHQAKGLEYPAVIIPSAPSRRMTPEDYRTLLVAVTRAQHILHIERQSNLDKILHSN